MEKSFLYTGRKLMLCSVCLNIFSSLEKVFFRCAVVIANYSFCSCCKAICRTLGQKGFMEMTGYCASEGAGTV